jgi:class 3 adenylate cyclase
MALPDVAKLKKEIEELSIQLKISQEKYLAEKLERERFEKLYLELTQDVFPLVIKELRAKGRIHQFNTKTLLIMFVDVVGFSKMTDDERQLKVDLLRLIGRSILQSESGMYINTWGDGIVAAFEDPTQGLRCACKFVSHLDLDGIEVRVGVNWGLARIVYNEMTQRLDIDGESINIGARLEPLAIPGEVIASELVPNLPDLDKNKFLFAEKEVELKKAVANKSAAKN